jgi:hypothetical protein
MITFDPVKPVTRAPNGRITRQVRTVTHKLRANSSLKISLRFDDLCNKGHESFTITAELYAGQHCTMAGCLHREIARYAPELAPYIKWHLCSTDGPMHYLTNTLHLAGDADCHGLRAGEFKPHIGKDGLPQWHIPHLKEYRHRIEYIHRGDKPAPLVLEYKQYGTTGTGKDRELDAARSTAIWPNATDEQLSLPRKELQALLTARLPGLIAEFKSAMLELGFEYPERVEVAA